MNFKEELNEEQYAAVTAPDGPSLVIAAAGTGKTRTLVYRVAWLLEQGVDPNRILLLTFTNKAAKEMLERARILTGDAVSGLLGGTFHHLANRLLRRYATRIGFGNDYTILDSDDSKKLLKSCADDLKMDKKHFPKPQVLMSIFSVVNGRGSDLFDELVDRFEHTEIDCEDVVRVHDEYQQRKKAQNAMDFDDLLIYTLKLFQTSEQVRNEYQERFQYVLVDEYQDTNIIQAEWINLLAGKHNNLMVVGDDFQSIYSWRGANFRNFLEFGKRYPGTNTYKLLTNYRSTPEILEVANAAIAGNPEQFQKELHAVRNKGMIPAFVSPRDGSEQARFIIEKAQRLKREGVALSDMCILYRAHFHAMELQMELNRASMAYVVTSGTRFFEQAHIKDVCTVLRILANPGDELAFTRLLELFPKVGKKTSLKIFRNLDGRVNLQRKEACMKVEAALPAAARESWKLIEPIFLAYREENLDSDPGEIVYRFNKVFYNEYMAENFDNAKYRAEDIDGFIDFTTKFETVEAFLSEIALQSNLDAEENAATDDEPADAIRLSTIHQAKGLEFKAVFILFLCESMFPGQKAVEESGDSEERRLFYVAVTRAEDHLFLCSPQVRRQRDGGVIPLEPSRFIREIPPQLLQKDQGSFPTTSTYTPRSTFRQETPPQTQHSKPIFTNTLNTTSAVQTHLQPLKETVIEVSLEESLSEVTFSEGIAMIEVLLNKTDLPGFSSYKHEKVQIPGSIFHESLNHLHQCKEICKLSPEFSLKIEVQFDQSTIHQITLLENNLSKVLSAFIRESKSAITHPDLIEFIENEMSFIDTNHASEKDLDNINTQKRNEKHGDQMEYLSSKHKLEYGQVIIGSEREYMLFILEYNENIFFIWEMLNDENATYIWKSIITSTEAKLSPEIITDEFKLIEADAQTIKPGNKRSFRKKQKMAPNFSSINHTYNENGKADLTIWKKHLFEKMDTMIGANFKLS